MSLNSRIKELEDKIIALEAKIYDLSANTEEKVKAPYTVLGGPVNKSLINPFDLTSKLGMHGGTIFWNDSEVYSPNQEQPPAPTKGYHKHSHSRFSGGALINGVLEIVEYVWESITNKHSQQFLTEDDQPKIAVDVNSKGETVEKIGTLDLSFNPDTQTWGCTAYEIDVTKCYLVEREIDGPNVGQIKKDSKGNDMRSCLWNIDSTKSSVIWDENAQVWRFYAVYAPGI